MLELKLEKYARVLLYAAPFLVLIFIGSFYFPFVITRTIYFRLALQLGLSLYLLLLALNFKKYRPRFNFGLALVIIFLSIQLTAAIFGLDFYKSFWSDFERMEGAVSLIYLAVYLFLLQSFLREKKQWLFYIRLILISAALVSLYGLAQKFNILPVFEAGIGRVTSTIGNAAFLAGYLLLALGLGIYYYFNETEKNYKYFALASGGLNLIVLFLTSTRGAILGLMAGVMVFLLLNAIYLSGRIKKNYLAVIIVLTLIFAGFFVFRARLADSNIEFIRRLATISAQDITVLNRLTVWRMALKDFKFHPWLGVGRENFDIIYNKYYRPDISENWFDRTHNVYLDELMAGGILGLAAYLAILAYLFCLLFKKRREDYWRFSIFSSLLIAYGIHNFFVFDTLNTSFLYFFLIGLIGFAPGRLSENCHSEPKAKNLITRMWRILKILRYAQNDKKKFSDSLSNHSPNNKAFNSLFIVLIIINILVFYKLVYLPFKINRAIYNGYYYVVADSYRSHESFKQALNYKFGSTEAAVQLNKALEITEAQGNSAVKEKYLALATEKLRFASINFPLDIKAKMYLGQLILNNYQDIKELDEAESLLLEAKRLSPSRVEPYYLLYNLYSKKKEKQKARAILESLVKQLPWYGGAKVMLSSDLYQDEPLRAEELLQAGIKQPGATDFGAIKKIIAYLLDKKRYEEVVPYYNELIEDEPKRYDYRLDLAKVYYLAGRFDKAVEQINVINENSPETLNNFKEFVSMLYDAYNKR